MQTITIDNITYNLVPVEIPVDYKKPRYKKYYYVDDMGEANSTGDNEHHQDNYRHTTQNYFETSDEMIQYRDYLLALGRINHRIHEMNEGWKADWNNIEEYKCIVLFGHSTGNWGSGINSTIDMMPIFTYAKSEAILNTLFLEMADDFETVRVWAMR